MSRQTTSKSSVRGGGHPFLSISIQKATLLLTKEETSGQTENFHLTFYKKFVKYYKILSTSKSLMNLENLTFPYKDVLQYVSNNNGH